jgi:hypothetical protein
MEISYDADKRALILATRGLDFEDTVEVFAGTELTIEGRPEGLWREALSDVWIAERAPRCGRLDTPQQQAAHHHDVESE